MYRGRIERDFALWVSKGLVSETAAQAMLAEYDTRDSSFSVGRVLLTLAAVLLSAAILLLVAANWDALPRITRVVGIGALIWMFYISAGLCLGRGLNGVGAAFLVMGTMTFGGAIALVGQMYHLSGDTVDSMLVWFAAACVATIAFRSGALTVVSGFLSWAVFGALIIENETTFEGTGIIYLVPLFCVVVIALVRYTGASRARHLAYLLMLGWLGWLYIEISEQWLALVFFIVGLVCFLAASLPASPLYRLARQAGAAPSFYAFLLALIGLAALHLEVDGLGADIVIRAVALAVSLAGIGIAGRMNGAVRYLGYAVFAGETLYIASETLGSILGTSGFFLISGIVVALIAWIVIRLEKRFSAKPVAEGM